MFKDTKRLPALLLWVSIVLTGPNLYAQSEFTIRGTTGLQQAGTVQLQWRNGNNLLRDSAQVTNGHFSLKGIIETPVVATLRFEPTGRPERSFEDQQKQTYKLFLNKGANIDLKAGEVLSTAVATGSSLHNEYVAYRQAIMKIYLKMQPVNMAIQQFERQMNRDSATFYKEKLSQLNKEEEAFLDSIIEIHPSSPVSLLAVYEFNRPGAMIVKPTRPFFEKLDPALQKLPLGVQLKQMLDERDLFGVGKQASSFSLPDTSGKIMDFSALKSRYVLLDFWASWCGPCRGQNPFMLEAYKKFKSAGFEIVSISLDNNRSSWLKAIRDDRIEKWIHVSDLSGKNSQLASLYHITNIPQNFLIDKSTNTIVARNLYGLELEKKLTRLLSKQ